MNKSYNLYLNGECYGSGNGEYMVELISDWIINHECYGNEETTFQVKERKRKYN